MVEDLLAGLNPQQAEAVTAVEGPVLVLAGPGSGKTRVLTHRIAWLVRETGVPAHHLLSVTFTNKAAAEMRGRVEQLLGGRLAGLQIGTFHSICARLLRVEAGAGVLPYGQNYSIYDTDDQQRVVKGVLSELNVDTKRVQPGRVLNAISAAKNELITPDEFRSADYFGEIVRRAYGQYQKRLVENNAMDFDDLLMNTALLLRDHDDVREKYQQRYEYVLVDEFQDTNQAQYQLVRILGRPQENVFVVGDEDQGIYAFRGADYRNVMQFRKDYPAAKVILLEQNYRSTQVVLDTARAIIDKNKHRTPKALFTDRSGGALVTVQEAYSEQEEGEWIARRIEELRRQRKDGYADFAVMYRTNAQSRALEEAFVRAGVPYRLVGGVGFYRRREVKDLIAYLKLINNPNDREVFKRVVNVPGRGIGEKSVASFLDWAQGQNLSLAEALEAAADGVALPVVGRAAKGLVTFAQLLRDLRFMAAQNLLAAFDELTARTGYHIYLNEISDTAEQVTERQENVQALRGVIAEKKDLALDEFLADASLVAEIDQLDPSVDAVTLLTLHSAKGLEFPVVFITGVEDGLLPHSRTFSEPEEMAEERRLLYVGLTRARDELYLTYAFRRALYGDSTLSTPSRFFDDIPSELTTGLSPRLRGAQQRSGYKYETTWEREERPASVSGAFASPKIIAFPAGGKVSGGSRPAPAGPPTKYQPGMRVYHTKFGKGTVQSSKVISGDEEVQVRFEQAGVKLLSASFANLVVLDE